VSWFNKGEVDIVVNVVKSLLAEAQSSVPPLRPDEIGIMAPWREQVRLLREELRKADAHAVDVGTVEVGFCFCFFLAFTDLRDTGLPRSRGSCDHSLLCESETEVFGRRS